MTTRNVWQSRGLRIALSLLMIAGASGALLTSSGCAKRQTQTTTAAKTTYTCPMHPEVVSDKPGKCPKCGMNLEPVQKPPTTQQG